MIHYDKPYPKIKDLIKNKDYDYVSYRMMFDGADKEGEFAGCFAVDNGRIIPLDGDSYDDEEEVIASEEWNNPGVDVKHGLTVIVAVEVISG